jgi:hypothetical protein
MTALETIAARMREMVQPCCCVFRGVALHHLLMSITLGVVRVVTAV